jgi:hypothetical protein
MGFFQYEFPGSYSVPACLSGPPEAAWLILLPELPHIFQQPQTDISYSQVNQQPRTFQVTFQSSWASLPCLPP